MKKQLFIKLYDGLFYTICFFALFATYCKFIISSNIIAYNDSDIKIIVFAMIGIILSYIIVSFLHRLMESHFAHR